MLVDDNIDDVFLTKRTLRKAGIDAVRVASDGQEALDMLFAPGEPLPELLILDLRLPKIHGLKVFTEVRRNNRTKALPVLILSSSEDPKDCETCLKLGAIAFLNKPLEISSLQQVLA
jgi:CheY-like chemotaxis protein